MFIAALLKRVRPLPFSKRGDHCRKFFLEWVSQDAFLDTPVKEHLGYLVVLESSAIKKEK